MCAHTRAHTGKKKSSLRVLDKLPDSECNSEVLFTLCKGLVVPEALRQPLGSDNRLRSQIAAAAFSHDTLVRFQKLPNRNKKTETGRKDWN